MKEVILSVDFVVLVPDDMSIREISELTIEPVMDYVLVADSEGKPIRSAEIVSHMTMDVVEADE